MGLSYFRCQRIDKVTCEEKHMGSRAVVIVCRDEDVARERFGVIDEVKSLLGFQVAAFEAIDSPVVTPAVSPS